MLHELLLALSGHPSPLFPEDPKHHKTLSPVLSPSERALIQSLAHLGQLHAESRRRALAISGSNASTVCRAVANAVASTHLESFQQKILDVERGILQDDPRLVGAYEIEPLSGVLKAFDRWERVLEWLRDVVVFVQAGGGGGVGEDHGTITTTSTTTNPSGSRCTGARLIDHLRRESRTGYPEIERVAVDLVRVAESAWLRQVAAWALYGQLPAVGADDFMIRAAAGSDSLGQRQYAMDSNLIPGFVTTATATSLLFIGRSLGRLQERGLKLADLRDETPSNTTSTSNPVSATRSLLASHTAHLSSLTHPIAATAFSCAIVAIRASLAQNALQKLLPLPEILGMLDLLQDYFLLRRGEFAMALIGAADASLRERQQQQQAHGSRSTRSHKDVYRLGGIMIKEGEVAAVLGRAWASLASLGESERDDEAGEEEERRLDLARDLIRLSLKKQDTKNAPSQPQPQPPSKSQHTTTSTSATAGPTSFTNTTLFDDVLLSTPTALSLTAPPPLDLFLTPAETDAYAAMHAYLLGLRRAHTHLAELWTLSGLRRVHPAPRTSMSSTTTTRVSTAATKNGSAAAAATQDSVARSRLLADARQRNMRATWATIGRATAFLAELTAYLQGEVVAQSWAALRAWIVPGAGPGAGAASGLGSHSRPGSSATPKGLTAGMGISTRADTNGIVGNSMDSPTQPPPQHQLPTQSSPPPTPRDPEQLHRAHALYLKALARSLLLTDAGFTSAARQLLTRCDHLGALMRRLASVRLAMEALERSGDGLPPVPRPAEMAPGAGAGAGEGLAAVVRLAEGDEVVDAVPPALRGEEDELLRALEEVRRGVQANLTVLLDRLRVLGRERGRGRDLAAVMLGELDSDGGEADRGGGGDFGHGGPGSEDPAAGGYGHGDGAAIRFVPWTGDGVDRLLLRLEGGA